MMVVDEVGSCKVMYAVVVARSAVSVVVRSAISVGVVIRKQ